jgi:hypothetical protein
MTCIKAICATLQLSKSCCFEPLPRGLVAEPGSGENRCDFVEHFEYTALSSAIFTPRLALSIPFLLCLMNLARSTPIYFEMQPIFTSYQMSNSAACVMCNRLTWQVISLCILTLPIFPLAAAACSLLDYPTNRYQ